VIVWLNGAFGAGKSSTARKLVDLSVGLRLFDPEWVGLMLRANLGDHEFTDFQQLPPWRMLVPAVAGRIADFTGQDLVAAQTVLHQEYWAELQAGMTRLGHRVVHVLLDAPIDVLRARIAADRDGVDIRAWRHGHVEVYAEARPWLTAAADHIIDVGESTPEEAATEIDRHLDHS
jgi:chloramphenicol 3-O-phosphotransferase